MYTLSHPLVQKLGQVKPLLLAILIFRRVQEYLTRPARP